MSPGAPFWISKESIGRPGSLGFAWKRSALLSQAVHQGELLTTSDLAKAYDVPIYVEHLR